jgi:hypothetical protein
MVEKVLPAIKLKWPNRDREIVIQQDGASSHINQDDAAFALAALACNWQIQLLTQPAQSPDTNIEEALSWWWLVIENFYAHAFEQIP